MSKTKNCLERRFTQILAFSLVLILICKEKQSLVEKFGRLCLAWSFTRIEIHLKYKTDAF